MLIYERIREEAHLGRSVISALDAGFRRAFATIIDSNVTMFVAALILYLFGSGAVRGFAVSLGLGILTSIITAVTMTRMMIALWYHRGAAEEAADMSGAHARFGLCGMKLLRLAPENTKFGFMRFRRVSYPLSALLSIVSVLMFLFVGMNFGIDFAGGTQVDMRAKSGEANVADIRTKAESLGLGPVEVQRIGGESDVHPQAECAARRRSGRAGRHRQAQGRLRRRLRVSQRRIRSARPFRANSCRAARSAWSSPSSRC